MGLLSWVKESKASRCIHAVLQSQKGAGEGVAAARGLKEFGSERCVPILCEALARGELPLRVEAAHALAAIYARHPDKQVLGALNGAILHERQPRQARQAAVEGLVGIVDVRHAGSLLELLKSQRTPVPLRAAALRGLKKLGYHEVLERLVESVLFGKRQDPKGEIRKWAVNELIALDDRDKLTKIHEIAHGRRKLRYRAFSDETGGPAQLVLLMAQIDPKAAMRLLSAMADDPNPAIRNAALRALDNIKAEA